MAHHKRNKGGKRGKYLNQVRRKLQDMPHPEEHAIRDPALVEDEKMNEEIRQFEDSHYGYKDDAPPVTPAINRFRKKLFGLDSMSGDVINEIHDDNPFQIPWKN